MVGRECLRQLFAERAVARVTAVVRRPLPAEVRALPGAEKLVERIIDFDQLRAQGALPPVDAILCALGTTIKQAGSQEQFRRVDHDYPLTLARLGLEQGARHYLLVSALGADASSRVFYNRVKGELENALRALPYRSLTIVRPSLLLGERSEFRIGEEIAKRVGWLAPPRFKPVHASAVAAVLVRALVADVPGQRTIESKEIHELMRESSAR